MALIRGLLGALVPLEKENQIGFITRWFACYMLPGP